MYRLQHFRESGSFATAELSHVPSLTNEGTLASLGHDYPGWEIKKILIRTPRWAIVLFQKTNQPVEYLCHTIHGGYSNLRRFISSQPVRETIFSGLWGKFDGLNTLADKGWRIVDVIDSSVLMILFKRPVQREAGQETEDTA